jgi:hypothetical protein
MVDDILTRLSFYDEDELAEIAQYALAMMSPRMRLEAILNLYASEVSDHGEQRRLGHNLLGRAQQKSGGRVCAS